MAGALLGAGAGIALYDYFTSKGQKLTITTNVMNSLVINSTTNVSTKCFSELTGDQVITINGGTVNTNKILEACTYCLQHLKTINDYFNQLETKALQLDSNYKKQKANDFLETITTTGSNVVSNKDNKNTLAPCDGVCNNVLVINVSQSQNLKATQECNVESDITNQTDQNIKGSINNFLENKQDIFGQLATAFTTNRESITTNLSQSLSQNITSNFVQSLNQIMQSVQSIQISGNSVLADGLDQSFTGTQVGTLTVTNTVVDQLKQSAGYSIAQSLINKNDTIGDLSKDFIQVIASMSELLDSVSGQFLILLAAVMIGIIFVVGFLYIFNKNFKQSFSESINRISGKDDFMIKYSQKQNKQTNIQKTKSVPKSQTITPNATF
jgi:hypothetical protein